MKDRFKVVPVGSVDWGIVENLYLHTLIFSHPDKHMIVSLCDSLNQWENHRELNRESKEWKFWKAEMKNCELIPNDY